MPKKIKHIFIDSSNRTVTQLEEHCTLEYLQQKMGGYIECATQFAIGHLNHTLYVDEEGRLKKIRNYFLLPRIYPEPLAGNGIIVGLSRSGDSTDCRVSLEDIRSQIRWLQVPEIEPEIAARMRFRFAFFLDDKGRPTRQSFKVS